MEPEECDAYGIDLPPLKERFDRFDEGVEAIVGLLSQDDDHTSTGSTSSSPTRGASPSRCSGRTRRSPSAAAARRGRCARWRRWAQQWNVIVAEPGASGCELKEMLVGHCAAIGRDPAEITCSVNVRVDPDAGAASRPSTEAAAYRDAGADLVDHEPAATRRAGHRSQPLAEALAPLA